MNLNQFQCFDLQTNLLYTIEEIVKRGGAHVIYGDSILYVQELIPLLTEEWVSQNIPDKNSTFNIIKLSPSKHSNDKEMVAGIYCLSEITKIDINCLRELPGNLRKVALGNSFTTNPLILLVPSICYDFFNRSDESLFVSLDNAHEYLLWADNESPKTPNQAWSGSGFAGWRFDEYHSGETTPFPYSPTYHGVLDKTLEKLHGYEKLLMSKGVDATIHQYTHNKFLRALIDFLPAYRYEDELITTNFRKPDEPDGPIEWKNIFALDYHQRQLLLNGLLTLWPNSNKTNTFVLQPASLALLYWAAKRLQYPHSSTDPEEFMRQYFDYSYNKNESYKPKKGQDKRKINLSDWFGGSLMKNDEPAEIVNNTDSEKSSAEQDR